MDSFTSGPYVVMVDHRGIVIKKGSEELTLQPGEAASLTSHLAFVARMVSLPALPPVLEAEHFRTQFSGDGTVSLFRHDSANGLSFSIDDTDDVIELVNASVKKFTDYLTLRGGPRPGTSRSIPDPIIDGR